MLHVRVGRQLEAGFVVPAKAVERLDSTDEAPLPPVLPITAVALDASPTECFT
jgi:hypothetical protein